MVVAFIGESHAACALQTVELPAVGEYIVSPLIRRYLFVLALYPTHVQGWCSRPRGDWLPWVTIYCC